MLQPHAISKGPQQTAGTIELAIKNIKILVNVTRHPADRATNGVAKDSHMFILRLDGKRSFWHVYFRATVAGRSTPFFAELRGEEKPNEVLLMSVPIAGLESGIQRTVDSLATLGPLPEGLAITEL
uniref:Uncharacterized protein n=1 Tax=Oryza punctata TaxID=4537 RepID=A0A0E0L5A4_ORYPU